MSHLFDRVKDAVATAPKEPLAFPTAIGIPHPRQPVQGQTDDELHLRKQAARAQEAVAHNEEMNTSLANVRNSELAAGERAKQLWGVVRGFTGKQVSLAAAGTNRAIREVSISQDHNAFVKDFAPLVGSSATYVNTFLCAVISGIIPRRVTLHVCSTHLCFDGPSIREVIALTDVASIIPSVVLPTQTDPPMFIPVPDVRVKPNAVQVFLRDKRVLQLSSFSKSVRQLVSHESEVTSLDLFYTEVDKSWRNVVRVPLEGVDYQL